MVRPDVDAIRELAIDLDPELANAVARWEIEVGEDWLGGPAIHLTIVFKDSEIRRVWKSRGAYRERLRDELLAMAPEHYPFIRFSAESEALNPDQPVQA
jgi:hypothetical protein